MPVQSPAAIAVEFCEDRLLVQAVWGCSPYIYTYIHLVYPADC